MSAVFRGRETTTLAGEWGLSLASRLEERPGRAASISSISAYTPEILCAL